MEGIVRKIEKTALDLSGGRAVDLTVGGVPASRYIQQFSWDYAKYPNRRPLKEIVALISGGAAAVDEELKQLGSAYGDKQTLLQEAKRKQRSNLLMADLNDVLTPEVMKNVEVLDTEYLKTVFIAVPKGGSGKENFEVAIEKVGHDLVGYGGPDWTADPSKLGEPVLFGSQVDRHKQRGSPVVPGSAKKIHEDGDSILYTVTILKSQYEAGYYEGDEFQPGTKVDFTTEFEKACRDKRFIVREFKYDPTQANKSGIEMEQLQVDVEGMKSGLLRWCKTHYGEVYVAWMHTKVIRVFVESVLRYGLPVDFTAVLYKAHNGKEHQLIEALDKAISGTTEKDADDEGDEYHEFVLLKFEV